MELVRRFHDFYPRSPCGERPTGACDGSNSDFISIHALLAESDASFAGLCKTNFPFLSTLSLRRATSGWTDGGQTRTNFYPRSPCGERQVGIPNTNTSKKISIHALLAESDTSILHKILADWGFLSTLSLRRATAAQGAHLAAGLFLSTLSLRRATFG